MFHQPRVVTLLFQSNRRLGEIYGKQKVSEAKKKNRSSGGSLACRGPQFNICKVEKE